MISGHTKIHACNNVNINIKDFLNNILSGAGNGLSKSCDIKVRIDGGEMFCWTWINNLNKQSKQVNPYKLLIAPNIWVSMQFRTISHHFNKQSDQQAIKWASNQINIQSSVQGNTSIKSTYNTHYIHPEGSQSCPSWTSPREPTRQNKRTQKGKPE